MSILFNDFKRQYNSIKSEIDDAIHGVLDSGWYILWKEVEAFEKDFAEKNWSKFAIWVWNWLDAIRISLLALWIWAWDEVITTSHSAVATTLAILDVWATPVFVDIDDYYNIDAEKIEEKINANTKAILPVHIYWQASDIVKIKSICDKYNLFLIEDCAQSHFTELNNIKVWNFWDLSCFSFYPTKNLWSYWDAWMIITNNQDLFEKCKMIRNYWQANRYEHLIYWVNSRLDEIQAAILRVQLKHIDANNTKRSQIADKYFKWLSWIDWFQLPLVKKNSKHTYHLFVVETKNRDELMNFLKDNWIPSLIHYPISIHKQPFLNGKYDDCLLPILDDKVKRILSIPIHPFLEDEEVDFIISKIKEFFNVK